MTLNILAPLKPCSSKRDGYIKVFLSLLCSPFHYSIKYKKYQQDMRKTIIDLHVQFFLAEYSWREAKRSTNVSNI